MNKYQPRLSFDSDESKLTKYLPTNDQGAQCLDALSESDIGLDNYVSKH